MLKVLIPQAFENMEEATIGRWLQSEGAAIREGQALCELVTEKTTFDLPAENVPEGAVLRKIVAPEKSVVPVGFCIALVGEETEELLEAVQAVESENARLLLEKQQAGNGKLETASLEIRASNLALGAPSTPVAGSRIRATPAARRAARERGLNIEEIAAAFPGKVLTEDDVVKFNA